MEREKIGEKEKRWIKKRKIIIFFACVSFWPLLYVEGESESILDNNHTATQNVWNKKVRTEKKRKKYRYSFPKKDQ